MFTYLPWAKMVTAFVLALAASDGLVAPWGRSVAGSESNAGRPHRRGLHRVRPGTPWKTAFASFLLTGSSPLSQTFAFTGKMRDEITYVLMLGLRWVQRTPVLSLSLDSLLRDFFLILIS